MNIGVRLLNVTIIVGLFVGLQILCLRSYAIYQQAKAVKLKKKEFTPVNLLSCPSCTFPTRYLESDSTENDAIFSIIENETTNIFPFIRSLRTTYTKAKLVLFVTKREYAKFDKNMHDFFRACGVTAIKLETVPSPKNAIYVNFLKDHMTTFDRILIVDFIDTIFQGDPFHSKFPRDAVGVIGTMLAGTTSNIYNYLTKSAETQVKQFSETEYATAASALSGKVKMHKIGFFKADDVNDYPLLILEYDRVKDLRDSVGWACGKVFKSPGSLMRFNMA